MTTTTTKTMMMKIIVEHTNSSRSERIIKSFRKRKTLKPIMSFCMRTVAHSFRFTMNQILYTIRNVCYTECARKNVINFSYFLDYFLNVTAVQLGLFVCEMQGANATLPIRNLSADERFKL